MMLGSKGILPPLIPNCYVLCTLAILKTFVIRSFFFKKWLLTHINYTITHMKKKVLEELEFPYFYPHSPAFTGSAINNFQKMPKHKESYSFLM